MSEHPDTIWAKMAAEFAVDELVSRALMPRENFDEAVRIVHWELRAQLALRDAERDLQANSN